MKRSIIIILSVSTLYGDEPWSLPNKKLRYDQVCYLTAHNAYSSKAEGFNVYYQHTLSIKEQLAYGVRAFMLDTYYYNKDVHLCHGSCSTFGIFKDLKSGIKGALGSRIRYAKFATTMHEIKQWLDKHPQEVITIILENYVPLEHIKTALDSVPGLANMILTSNSWDPVMHDGYWPTLEWLQKKNKRIIVFDSFEQHERFGFFYQWFYTVENQFGTFNLAQASRERKESRSAFKDALNQACTHTQHTRTQWLTQAARNRRLFVLNYFGTISSSTADKDNSYEKLSKLVQHCKNKGLANKRNPNFIALDMIGQGNPLKLVNQLNKTVQMA